MLTDRQEELLIILMEECSEVQKECSKVLRFDDDPKARISYEVGDLLCMIGLLQNEDLLDMAAVEEARKGKVEKLKRWMKYNED